MKKQIKKILGVILSAPVGLAIIGGTLYGIWWIGKNLLPLIGVYMAQFLLGFLFIIIALAVLVGLVGGIVKLLEEEKDKS